MRHNPRLIRAGFRLTRRQVGQGPEPNNTQVVWAVGAGQRLRRAAAVGPAPARRAQQRGKSNPGPAPARRQHCASRAGARAHRGDDGRSAAGGAGRYMARPRRDRQMPDESQRLAIIECTVCNACLDIYRCLQDGEEHLDWQMRDADLCPHPPPLHRCPQARLEVRRRFPGETLP